MSGTAIRPLAIAGLLALLTAARPLAADESGWRLHQSRRGGFRAELPAAPDYAYREHRSLLGRVPRHHTWVDHPKARLDIERNELPRLASFFATPQYILDTARDDLMSEVGGRLEREEPITLQGHPGRRIELVHPLPEPHPEEVRLVLAGRSLYVISAGPFDPAFRDSIVERFFASFRLCLEDVAPCPDAPAEGP